MTNAKIYITVPSSWGELADGQLYYVYNLFADNLSLAQIKTYCFFTWSKVKIVCRYGDGFIAKLHKQEFFLSPEVVASALRSLDYLDTVPDVPVRISHIKRACAADAQLVGFPFDRYLYCENLYQGYLQVQDHTLLVQMAQLLYDDDGIKLNQAEKMNVFWWWMAIKQLFGKQWPHFFQGVTNSSNLLHANTPHPPTAQELQDAMNAQIRALTKGDVTKEKEILALDTWRALTELDAQAREYEEMQRTMPK
ncbi:MAG: hypothetical protein J6X22_03935 [Muribaculaceae bacterium]|nr:hypothetical protein [Muribaculaceae bacterium]